jgi:spore coat protein U-like protein
MLREKKDFILFALGFLGILAIATAGVSYGGDTVTVPVKVNLVGSCDIQNTPEINFGGINPLEIAANHNCRHKNPAVNHNTRTRL